MTPLAHEAKKGYNRDMTTRSDETADGYKLPRYGKLRGKRVLLKDAPDRLSASDLGEVTAMVDGKRIRPWRFSSDGSEVKVLDDRVLI
jgi:hypothetical protein